MKFFINLKGYLTGERCPLVLPDVSLQATEKNIHYNQQPAV